MDWLQALLLGIVQGLTEFLPVSSSGHLMIVRDLLGVDGDGFLDFTVTVHLATVLEHHHRVLETDLQASGGILQVQVQRRDRLCVQDHRLDGSDSGRRPVVQGQGGSVVLRQPFHCGCVSDCNRDPAVSFRCLRPDFQTRRAGPPVSEARNGISYWQALVVGLSQAVAVAPGLSRSGTTIATGLLCGVKREVMAQFSFLMVLVPIIGEQFLDLLKSLSGGAALGGGLSPVCLVVGFLAAFLSGLFACKVTISIVKKARLTWFALYCLVVSLLLLVFA